MWRLATSSFGLSCLTPWAKIVRALIYGPTSRTDGEGEWIIKAENGQAVTESQHGKADVAMRGPAEGLYWVLMGRGKPEEHGVEVLGDPALAASFKEWFPGP